ncbi:MAG: hypothetical protein ABI678_22335, partial [Kofleriaceae bacterium]
MVGLPVIRTRWFVVITIAVVAAIGALVYQDETRRSEAALGDLGERQAELASIAALTLQLSPDAAPALAARDERRSVILVAPPDGDFATLRGKGVALPPLRDLVRHGAHMARLSADEAAAIGLPARTAMVGLAPTKDGGTLAVATSAEHQRDRDRSGRSRVLLSMVLAAAVMTAFMFAIWRKQRH